MATVPHRLRLLVLVAGGGFAGSVCRYLVSSVVGGLGGTLLVNVSGSLVLGGLLHRVVQTNHLSRRTKLLTATGFLSSYTTYSTFAVETATATSIGLLVANVVATYVLGFGAVALAQYSVSRGTQSEVIR